MSIKICPKCKENHEKPGTFCSRSCANSRGPRTQDFKDKVSKKLMGKNYQTEQSILKGLEKRNLIPKANKPDTICLICNKSTYTKHRKTCSDNCYSIHNKTITQNNPKCGGQKHTNRTKIQNNRGEIFLSESSYESLTSDILNTLNIYWIRPSFFLYEDSFGKKRRYYPDFYLPEHNIYLDPKNDFLIKTDIDKIFRSSRYNNIRIIILGYNAINKECISKLVVDEGNAPSSPACKTGVLLLN